MRSPLAVVGLRRSLGEKPIWEGVLALLGCGGYCVFAHSVNGVECAREVWACEAFNSFIGDGFQVSELKGESESSGVARHWIAWIW